MESGLIPPEQSPPASWRENCFNWRLAIVGAAAGAGLGVVAMLGGWSPWWWSAVPLGAAFGWLPRHMVGRIMWYESAAGKGGEKTRKAAAAAEANAPTCCKGSSWVLDRDLGRAEGFECMLGKCARCGTPWMSVFCAGSSISGYEPVTADDVARFRSSADGPEMKESLRQWVARNI